MDLLDQLALQIGPGKCKNKTSIYFFQFLKTELGHQKNKAQLLIDNPASHTVVKNIKFFEENGRILLIFSFYYTYKLELMNRTVFAASEKSSQHCLQQLDAV